MTGQGFGYFNASQAPAGGHWGEMRKMGASLVRVWYMARWDGGVYVIDGKARANMLEAIDEANAAGLLPVICVGVSVADMPFGSPERTRAFLDLWLQLQKTHAHQRAAFDLLNEPMPPEGYTDRHTDEQAQRIAAQWRDLASLIVGALYAVDPQRVCVVQMGLGADPTQFARQQPLPLPGVVHSVHFYHPHSFTHHGVMEALEGRTPTPKAMSRTDMATAMRSLRRLGAWSKTHGLPIYVGEFSAHNILPDAPRYVAAVAEFANARGWPWTYHDWRQWPGWHPTDKTLDVLTRAMQPTKADHAA